MSCPDCFSGHKHTGDPQGREAKVHGLDTYIAEPKDGKPAKGIIVIVPDAFGWQFVNNKILADHYAAAGDYKVYLPDFMNGSAAPEVSLYYMGRVLSGNSIGVWVTKPFDIAMMLYNMLPFVFNCRFAVSWPIVKGFFEKLREDEGATLPVGAAGFCWGGKHTFNLAASDAKTASGKPLIDAGFTGHPSNISWEDESSKVVQPLSIAVGDEDMAMGAAAIKTVEGIFKKLEGVDTEVKVYPGAGHGFCVRADPLRDAIKQGIEAEGQAVDWFKKHFK